MKKRQRKIYEYIKGFLDENKYSPSMREIAKAVDLKSVSTVHGHLVKMRKKGYIDFINSSPRTLQVVRGWTKRIGGSIMIRDRGMQKWQGLMLPEHVVLLREHKLEQSKAPRPNLDGWDLEIIQETIEIAMKRNTDVEIKTWEDGAFISYVGRITWVDLKKRIIEMENTTKSFTLKLDGIVDVSILE